MFETPTKASLRGHLSQASLQSPSSRTFTILEWRTELGKIRTSILALKHTLFLLHFPYLLRTGKIFGQSQTELQRASSRHQTIAFTRRNQLQLAHFSQCLGARTQTSPPSTTSIQTKHESLDQGNTLTRTGTSTSQLLSSSTSRLSLARDRGKEWSQRTIIRPQTSISLRCCRQIKVFTSFHKRIDLTMKNGILSSLGLVTTRR